MFKPDSPEVKIAKGEHILTTATELLRHEGSDALSMNKLAAACGVAKGTLYLYFKTREEIIAAIYLGIFWTWLNGLPEALKRADYEGFCQDYCASLQKDPLLIPLICEAQTRIQHNIPLETLVEFKRSQTQGLGQLASLFADRLKVDEDAASRIVWAFQVATLGAASFIRQPDFSPSALPEDIHGLTFGLNFESMFLNAVQQINIYRT